MAKPSNTLRSLLATGLLDRKELAWIGDTTEEFVLRWLDNEALPDERVARRFEQTLTILSRLDPYYSENEVRNWLLYPHPQLEGERAIDRLRIGDTWSVSKTIDRLDACGYL